MGLKQFYLQKRINVIPVTKSFLPPIEEYVSQLKRSFDNGWLTNRGELVLELEQKLVNYFNFSETNIICMNNGTIPLQIAVKLLGNEGEIITTPFSYVATSAAIAWQNCTPVFVDINPDYLTIDETKIEAAITKKTTCILATHVFGNPCNVEEIERIAKKYNLKVIYDAAHCFGVKYKGKSIFEYGDVSTCSFHATKLFHSGEGGAVFCSDKELFHKLYYSHNFGHNGPLDFYGIGINGKMSEIQAALGLSVLPYIEEIYNSRSEIVSLYNSSLNFSNIQTFKLRENTIWNNSYFPILFETEENLKNVQDKLNQLNIFPRRYFYPSLNSISYFNTESMPISENISKRILCLPLYYGLETDNVNKIIQVINN